MDTTFKPLDCDADVLLFDQETYLVGRFRELVQQGWHKTFNTSLGNNSSEIIDMFLGLSISRAAYLRTGEIKWNSSSEGIKCKLLKIGAKGWEQGKFRTQVSINIIPAKDHRSSREVNIQVCLEFCPDEPKQPESPLDDIRKMLKDEQ